MTRRLIIDVQGLRKSFGAVEALRGVDFSVPEGKVLGLLGPNGAGKTTAVRILTTLLDPSGGRAMVCGFDVVRQAAAVRRVDRSGRSGHGHNAGPHRLREPGDGRTPLPPGQGHLPGDGRPSCWTVST